MADRRSDLPSGRFAVWDIASAESPAPSSPSAYGDENSDPNADVQDDAGDSNSESDGEWADGSDSEDSEEDEEMGDEGDEGDAEPEMEEMEETEEEEEYSGNGDDSFDALVNDPSYGFWTASNRLMAERLGAQVPQIPEWRRWQPTEDRQQNRPAPAAQPASDTRPQNGIDPKPDFHIHEDEQEDQPAPDAAPTRQDSRALRDITDGAPTVIYEDPSPGRLRPRVWQYSLNVGKWLLR